MILSAKLWQELVDLFGNIPCSQAFQNAKYQSPAYYKAKDIYTSLQQKLDVAKSYMNKTAKGSFATLDVINHDNKAKWIRLANTLKLRLLIRQSEVADFNPATEIAKILAGGTMLNTLKAGDDVVVNPGFVNDNDKQSTFFANYGLTLSGTEASSPTRANNYF